MLLQFDGLSRALRGPVYKRKYFSNPAENTREQCCQTNSDSTEMADLQRLKTKGQMRRVTCSRYTVSRSTNAMVPKPIQIRIKQLEQRRVAIGERLMAASPTAEANELERELYAIDMVIAYYTATEFLTGSELQPWVNNDNPVRVSSR
jgi:hypothetical protein